MPAQKIVLATGATGLLGGRAVAEMLRSDARLRALVVIRDSVSWSAQAARLGLPADRITALRGDVRHRWLGLSKRDRAIASHADIVVHAAGDICFSRTLAEARAINTEGTREVARVTAALPAVRHLVYVSTAFVAGRSSGDIPESAAAPPGWVNAYERSKHEAEAIVRLGPTPWTILRPSTVVCDAATGGITQINAVHRALRLLHRGLVPMMPGDEATPVDVVHAEYVARAIAHFALDASPACRTVHLCAGARAMPLGELLDRTFAVWNAEQSWRRRSVARPVLTDLTTYELFERTVEQAGDARLRKILRSLSHFIPQLSIPKRFVTDTADARLGCSPEVGSFWPNMLAHLATDEAATGRSAA